LFEQLIVDRAPALIIGQEAMAICRRVKAIPAHEHGARLLACIEAQQVVRETHDRAAAAITLAPNRLRQGVIGAVGKGIAVNDQKRIAHASLA
jgi:hypothetical protein